MRAQITPGSGYSEQLLLNAYCIEFAYGGIYAWVYLAMAGLKDDEILEVLGAPIQAWCHKVGNAEQRARLAMQAVGLKRTGHS